MVRLAIVDPTDRGQQPFWSSCDRVAILFNGMIHNYRKERRGLSAAGYQIDTGTDTEVILASYLERRPNFAGRIRGMFAVAIFDWRDAGLSAVPSLVLARDHFGMKPLWLARREGGVAFASTAGARLASGLVPRRIDTAGVGGFLLQGFVLQPSSVVVKSRGFLREGAVAAVRRSAETNRPGAAYQKLWNLMNLGLWCRQVLDGDRTAAA